MLTPIPNPFAEAIRDFNCFLCGPNHQHGFRLTFAADGEKVVTTFRAHKDLCGIPGIFHGGLQAALLDETLWWTVFHNKKRFNVTKSLTTQYLLPIREGDELRVEGEITGEGKNVVHAKGGIFLNTRMAASAEGTYFLPNLALLARSLGKKPDEIPQAIRNFLAQDSARN